MSIELLTVYPRDYVESRGANLSDYEMIGVHGQFCGVTNTDNFGYQLATELTRFKETIPTKAEVVVKLIRNLSINAYLSTVPRIQYFMIVDGTALIPKKKSGGGKELRTVATNPPKSIDDDLDLGVVFGEELAKRDLVGVVK
ncbi:hypothetical protein HYV88_01405 [Candidatus Woesearchaeota archaeon]|nr:hypothetical protein [Candidatus Woesearchaeota archaeon]